MPPRHVAHQFIFYSGSLALTEFDHRNISSMDCISSKGAIDYP